MKDFKKILAVLVICLVSVAQARDLNEPLGGVFTSGFGNELYLACEGECREVLVVRRHKSGGIDVLNTFTKSKVAELKERVKRNIKDDINTAHSNAMFAGTRGSVYFGGVIAEETGLYENHLESNTLSRRAFSLVSATPGLLVDLLKALPQGILYAGEHLVSGLDASSLVKHLENVNEAGKVNELDYEDFNALEDALYSL